ncbi:cytochrome b5 reductase 4 isoform X2 [Tiliqua scincoides]|uniref:cytochrome b5 reductase 4 isoform X2 n=1 Tax=Tiliqua scincoides TaxID=71010 RepID=UPI00346210EB
MLNVPSQAFPAPSSQQRVAVAGRSKVPLKPGRSLMDWIRLSKSGKDLTGLKGRLIEVTEEELAKHNKKHDCWICIRGLVYNVTPYMEYHPGGEDELMKAAGLDGTNLFDQVHRWVNYESMLKECLVGRMAVKSAAALKELSSAVHEDMIVQVSEKVGKVEFVLKKKESLSWKTLGQPLESHDTFVKCTDRGLFYRKCKLISKANVTHDTRLFCLMLPPGTHLHVPVGYHLYLKQTITDTDIVKPYTPVSSSLVPTFKDPSCNDKMHIFFMIKIYPSGLFTPVLDSVQIGEYISVSNPEGNFRKMQAEVVEDLFLLAGGTGFTPMVKLLNYVLTRSGCLRTVKLMFFNKTEDDILWRNQLEQLALNDARFDVQFVLSEPNKGWTGKQGKVSSSLLSPFVKRSKCGSKILICICGPLPFMEQGMQFLQDLGHSCEEIHCFTA